MADLLPVPYSHSNLPAGQLSGGRRDEPSLRNLICHIGRLMHEGRYIEGISGNISARLDADHMLATPSGLALGFLQPEQIAVVSLDGADPNLSDELLMHLDCYRQRPEVNGIVHAHPPTAVALTIAGMSMRTCVVPEAVIVLGLVPTAAFQVSGSSAGREAVRLLINHHDAILIAHHGSITVGPDLFDAYLKLEILEHTATILHRAAQLGPVTPLTPEQVAPLLAIRRKLGYWRPGDDERFCEMCGVC